MKVTYVNTIYNDKTSENPFQVHMYRLLEDDSEVCLKKNDTIIICGNNLFAIKDSVFEITGYFKETKNHGISYFADFVSLISVSSTKDGIISYFTSGYIPGFNQNMAEKIFKAYGVNTFSKLDSNPNLIGEILSLKEDELNNLIKSYIIMRKASKIINILNSFNISKSTATEIYMKYKENTINVIANDPYILCDYEEINFKIVDSIAKSYNNYSPSSKRRIDTLILLILRENERDGNLYIDKYDLLNILKKQIGNKTSTKLLAQSIMDLEENKKIVISYNRYIYLKKAFDAESTVAKNIARITKFKRSLSFNIDDEITKSEKILDISLHINQRIAVKEAILHGITIITGGPGTGKTSVLKILHDVYKRNFSNLKISFLAPTGRAARRITESTSEPAQTIHKELNLIGSKEKLDLTAVEADVIIVDETSMLDIYVAAYLFKAIKTGSQIILVGDTDQLSSVGPGDVLYSLINCNKITVAILTKVFRQAGTSRVSLNAIKMQKSNNSFEYGYDFTLLEAYDFKKAADFMISSFIHKVNEYGLENVMCLSPFKDNTETGVIQLNNLIQEQLNPLQSESQTELVYKKIHFRVNDRVMENKNQIDVSNGDIGIVKSIEQENGSYIIKVDYDGRLINYSQADLKRLSLAYAITIHKSQGSEYAHIITTALKQHGRILSRNLLYTAITRAKKTVTLVSNFDAIKMAIDNSTNGTRKTMLSHKVSYYIDNYEILTKEIA